MKIAVAVLAIMMSTQAQAALIKLEEVASKGTTVLRAQIPPIDKYEGGRNFKTGITRLVEGDEWTETPMFVNCTNQTAGPTADTQGDLLVGSAAYAVYQRWCEE